MLSIKVDTSIYSIFNLQHSTILFPLNQAKNRPTGCLYDEGQLQEINDKVLKQLDELEGAIKDKF